MREIVGVCGRGIPRNKHGGVCGREITSKHDWCMWLRHEKPTGTISMAGDVIKEQATDSYGLNFMRRKQVVEKEQ